jgi:carboxymethylenebutenolidase
LTQTIDRRAAVAGLALLSLCPPARAATPEQLSIDADEGPVALTRYAAEQAGKRPSVLVLHGSHGFELKPRAYERYADALSAKGIDAYLLRYLTTADAPVFDPKTSTREKREAYEATRFDFWAKRVSTVVTAILARPDSSGRLGPCLASPWAATLPPPRRRATSALPHWVCCTAACRMRWCRKSSICRL